MEELRVSARHHSHALRTRSGTVCTLPGLTLESFEEARQRLHKMSITLSTKRTGQSVYCFSGRARQQQLIGGNFQRLKISKSDKVLFIADRAKWIWNRVADL